MQYFLLYVSHKERERKVAMEKALFHGDLVNTSRIIYTPSDFARISLFHIQEIGTLQATKPHTNRRENLSSYLFFIVCSGSGKLVYQGAEYPLHAGDCVYIDCRHPYAHMTDDNLWNLSWVHFDGPTAANIYQKYRERGGLPAFTPRSRQPYLQAFNNLYDVAVSASFTRDMDINARIADMLALLMADSWHPEEAQPGTKKTGLFDVKKYLDENYSQKITLDDLAERYYINKYYLARVFKEQFGTSVMDYLLSVRITEAKNMLRFTKKSAEDIGIACGIGDVYYLSRVFKKVEGIGIREFRKQWGGRRSTYIRTLS